ncbi:hypothetical protein BH11BAC1_BH11BAC1_25710 [soil metagenome]
MPRQTVNRAPFVENCATDISLPKNALRKKPLTVQVTFFLHGSASLHMPANLNQPTTCLAGQELQAVVVQVVVVQEP